MSAEISRERIGLLERLTGSTAFAVLFGSALLVLVPAVLLGLVVMPSILAQSARQIGIGEWAAALLLPIGGLIGLAGLLRTAWPTKSLTAYRLTMLCLGIGIATATVPIGAIVIGNGLGDPLFEPVIVVVLSLPVLAALGRIARLRRLRAAAEERVPDDLPLVFLLVALAEVGCALAIGAQLALAG
jgi:hypothetical protein